jgi:hypothetical protein
MAGSLTKKWEPEFTDRPIKLPSGGNAGLLMHPAGTVATVAVGKQATVGKQVTG